MTLEKMQLNENNKIQYKITKKKVLLTLRNRVCTLYEFIVKFTKKLSFVQKIRKVYELFEVYEFDFSLGLIFSVYLRV